MNSKPFLTFYENLGFAPTSTSDPHKLENLNILKNNLYESLGVTHGLLKYQDILEIGPGSGENVVQLLSFLPKSLTILDGSKSVLSALENRIQGGSTELNFILSDASVYKSQIKYDVIIAEGILPFQLHPINMLKNIVKLLKDSGIIIVTTADEFSMFSEVCRKYIAKRMFKDLSYSETLVNSLAAFFEKDFTFLPGMTRDSKHWIIDSIINPWIGDFFSIKDALEINDLKFFGVSPNIITDWRWYKDPSHLYGANLNSYEIETYKSNCVNFIDFRFTVAPISVETYTIISSLLRDFFYNSKKYLLGKGDYSKKEFEEFIIDLSGFSDFLHKETLSSINSLLNWSRSGDVGELEDFRKLWGRGQQFISLKNTNLC